MSENPRCFLVQKTHGTDMSCVSLLQEMSKMVRLRCHHTTLCSGPINCFKRDLSQVGNQPFSWKRLSIPGVPNSFVHLIPYFCANLLSFMHFLTIRMWRISRKSLAPREAACPRTLKLSVETSLLSVKVLISNKRRRNPFWTLSRVLKFAQKVWA